MREYAQLFGLLGRRFARVGVGGFFRLSRVVAFGSVFLGSMALTLALAILEGFQQTLYEQALRFTWHVQVRTFGGGAFAYGAVVERLAQGFPDAIVAAVREREALLRTREGIEGVLLRALSIPPERSPVPLRCVEGSAGFSSDTAAEVLLGEALARKLGVRAGDTVVVITTDGSKGELRPLVQQVRVVGIYRSGLMRYEELYVYLPFGRAGLLLGLPEFAATGVDLLLRRASVEALRSAPAQVEQLLRFPFTALGLYELHQPMFAWIELQRVPIPLVLGLLSLVAAFNVFTFLVLLVVERTPSFAILQALGMGQRQLRHFLLWQGIRLSGTAAVAGSAGALLLAALQEWLGLIRLQGAFYYVDRLPVAFVWWHPLVVIAVAVLLAGAASVIPALVARRIPVTALLHLR